MKIKVGKYEVEIVDELTTLMERELQKIVIGDSEVGEGEMEIHLNGTKIMDAQDYILKSGLIKLIGEDGTEIQNPIDVINKLPARETRDLYIHVSSLMNGGKMDKEEKKVG